MLRRPLAALIFVKRAAVFALALLLAYITYDLLLSLVFDSWRDDRHGLAIVALIALWLFTAYSILPRLHRRLVKLYLPDYFIGRTRTGDGMLGDPVNLAVIGSKSQLVKAMKAAGWQTADPLTVCSSLKMAIRTFTLRSYPTAPVSPLFLFGTKQALAFQQEVGDSTLKRHHVRFWKTPHKWWLPGGYRADWLGAATYDRRVGLSTFTLQITHKIAADIDDERDFVVQTLTKSGLVKHVDHVEHYASGFHSRNGGGDRIVTDGKLPFVYLQPVRRSK